MSTAKQTGNLHVALAMALGVRTMESDAELIERVRQLRALAEQAQQANNPPKEAP